jgi:hypothetical protein
LVCLAVTSGCGPKDTPTTGGTTAAAPAASSAPAASPTPTVKDLVAGNCTVYPKADAVKLLGGVNMNNKALDLNTGGGTKIDQCSYLDLKGMQDLQGISYAVVRYDSAATASDKVKALQTDMLGSAASNNWPVQSLTTPVPGSGPVRGGYGTKNDNGLTYTIAVVGTNVGPYLVTALGASTESPGNAKKFALAVFQALTSAVA